VEAADGLWPPLGRRGRSSAFKRAFGEAVRARKFAGAVSELLIKAALYNLFISL
jgi:hypothetical protein